LLFLFIIVNYKIQKGLKMKNLALLFSIIFTNLYSKAEIATNFIERILDLRQIDKNSYNDQANSLSSSQYEDLTSCIDRYNSLTRNLVVAGFEYLKGQKGASMPATASLLNLELTRLFHTNTDFKEKEVELAALRRKIELLVESQSQQKSTMVIPATTAAFALGITLLYTLYNWLQSKQPQPDNNGSSTSSSSDKTKDSEPTSKSNGGNQPFFMSMPKNILGYFSIDSSHPFIIPAFSKWIPFAKKQRKSTDETVEMEAKPAPEDKDRLAREEADRLAREDAERLAREEADLQKKQEQDAAQNLYQAILEDDITKVAKLLKEGALPNIKATKPKASPLFMAIYLKKSNPMIDLLLQSTTTDSLLQETGLSQWDTVMHEAVRKERIDVIDQLIKMGGPDFINKFTINPLFTAVYNNNTQILRHLLEKGADVNNINSGPAIKSTALMLATLYRNFEMAKLLIEYGADPTLKSHSFSNTEKDTNTPLEIAEKSPNMKKFVELYQNLISKPEDPINKDQGTQGEEAA
jgi:ankyrin repeat protein